MVPQPRIPSVKKLHLIMMMMSNGGVITFKTQDIYSCNKSFKKAMRELHGKGVILIRQMQTGNEYKLTTFGRNLGGALIELAT